MKTKLLLAFFLLLSTIILGQRTYVPDDNFEQALIDLGYDTVLDNYVTTANINTITYLDVGSKGINRITGIQDFTSLVELRIYDNNISSIDVSDLLDLENYVGRDNNISSINFSKNTKLKSVYIQNNNLTKLDVSASTNITTILCFGNNISSLILENQPNLSSVQAYDNNLTTVNLSKAPALRTLRLDKNNLTYLNIKNGNNTNISFFWAQDNPNLTCIKVDNDAYVGSNWSKDTATLYSEECNETYVPDDKFEAYLEGKGWGNNLANDNYVATSNIEKLTTLDLGYKRISDATGIEDFRALQELDFDNNDLTTLDVSSNTNLQVLRCYRNNLTSISVGSNTNLVEFSCYHNNLTELDVSQLTGLKILSCGNNLITNLDVSTLTKLETLTTTFTLLKNLDLSKNTNIDTFLGHSSGLTDLNVSNNPNLDVLDISNNNLTRLDLSSCSSLTRLTAYNNSLIELNVQNGNNGNVTYFRATGNPNLNCIQVDDATASLAWLKDTVASYSNNCYTYIPDNNFEQYLIDNNYDDVLDDYVLTHTVKSIDKLILTSKEITDMTGIEEFTSLTKLSSWYNKFTDLDVSSNVLLKDLDCFGTPIETLHIGANPNLTNVNMLNTKINSIDVTNLPNLQHLNIKNTDVTSLNIVNNTALKTLSTDNTSINILEVATNTQLEALFCSNTGLNTIDLTKLVKLKQLDCSDNEISILDLSKNRSLAYVVLENNNLKELNFKNGSNIRIGDTNTNSIAFRATGNPNLECITVDNASYSNLNWKSVDSQAVFNTNRCMEVVCPLSEIIANNDIDVCEATITVTPPTIIGAENQGALNFDGIDDQVLLSNINTGNNKDVTIELKIKFDNFDKDRHILAHTRGYVFLAILTLSINEEGILNLNLPNCTPKDQEADLGLKVDTWYNLAMVYEARRRTVKFYVDGKLKKTKNYFNSYNLYSSGEFSIGGKIDMPFDGSIDDFRIWKVARTQNQIQDGLNIDLSGYEPGLQVYYKFNEGIACRDNSNISTIIDISGGNRPGTLSGFDLTNTNTCESNFVESTTSFHTLTNDYNNSSELVDTFPLGSTTVNWTFTDAISTTTCSQVITVEDNQGICALSVNPKIYLQGAMLNSSDGLMRDDLRSAGYLPIASPYDGKTLSPTIFNTGGNSGTGIIDNDIVDWVWVELRDATDNTIVIDSQSALIQRDGDIVNTDGVSSLRFTQAFGNYYIVIKHRNHLGVMTASAVSLSNTTTIIDFTDANNQITFGSNAQTTNGMQSGTIAMCAGNANNDTIVQSLGNNSDNPSVLSEVLMDSGNLFGFPTYVINGYNNKDLNMDAKIQALGNNSETPLILQNVLAHPGNFFGFSTYQIIEQLPENFNQ